jgi:hypothetical protein
MKSSTRNRRFVLVARIRYRDVLNTIADALKVKDLTVILNRSWWKLGGDWIDFSKHFPWKDSSPVLAKASYSIMNILTKNQDDIKYWFLDVHQYIKEISNL